VSAKTKPHQQGQETLNLNRRKPDNVEVTSESKEIWTYKKHLWCGIIPCVALCAPLVLPVCSGTDHIYFEGDEAKRLHIKRSIVDGILLIPPAVGPPARACRFPIPIPLSKKIPHDKTVFLSIKIDHLEYQEENKYKVVSDRLHERLSSSFVSDGIFSAVVHAREAADFDMTVKILSASFGHRREQHLHMKIQIDDFVTKQSFGSFDVDIDSGFNYDTWDEAANQTIHKAIKQIIGAMK